VHAGGGIAGGNFRGGKAKRHFLILRAYFDWERTARPEPRRLDDFALA
jgi:hypothetical protein